MAAVVRSVPDVAAWLAAEAAATAARMLGSLVGVAYLIVGGVARDDQECSRLTQDLDLCYARDRENRGARRRLNG